MVNRIENYLSKVDFIKELEKDKNRIVFLITLELVLLGVTLLIQEYLRPNNVFASEAGTFMMGILPSFLGAMAYVLFFFVSFKLVQGYYLKYNLTMGLIFANSFTFLGLTLWELIRIVISPFDWWDVTASFLGCFSATILILSIYLNDKKVHQW